MNKLPDEVLTGILAYMSTTELVNVRALGRNFKNMSDEIIRDAYEEKLCEYFGNMRIHRRQNDGQRRIKDIFTYACRHVTCQPYFVCKQCGRQSAGILKCECFLGITKPLKRLLLGPACLIFTLTMIQSWFHFNSRLKR